jgi:hypothetical protein
MGIEPISKLRIAIIRPPPATRIERVDVRYMPGPPAPGFAFCSPCIQMLACSQVETPFRCPPKLITAGSVTEPTLPVTALPGRVREELSSRVTCAAIFILWN